MVSLSEAMVTFGVSDTAFCVLYYLKARTNKNEQKEQDLENSDDKMKENISKIVGEQLEKHFKIESKSYYLVMIDPGRDNLGWDRQIPLK